MLLEADIKRDVLQFLWDANAIDNNTIIAPEFSIPEKPVRADLALLTDQLIGIEIKGPRDSLRRLPDQISAYKDFFDTTIVVVASKHYSETMLLNLNARVWEISSESKIFTRENSPNVLQTPHCIGLEDLQLDQFREKYSATSKKFWRRVQRRKIKTKDLLLLSRFVEQRQKIKRNIDQAENYWDEWNNQAKSFFSQSA